MTTSMQVITAKNVFVDNDVYAMRREQYPHAFELGGIVWLRRGEPRLAHANALSTALSVLKRSLPSYQLVLLVAYAAPNTAVGRYRKFWGAFEAADIRLPRGRRIEQGTTADDGHIDWRGAIMINADDASDAIAFVEGRPLSMVIATPRTSTIETIVASGWTRSEHGPPTEIVEWVCSNAGIAFYPVGAFDDPESGVVAFCAPELVAVLEATSRAKENDATGATGA